MSLSVDELITIFLNKTADILQAILRADSRFAPKQWETSLQSNTISHWQVANLESALNSWLAPSQWEASLQNNIVFVLNNIWY